MSRTVAILGLGGRGTAWANAFHRAGWQIVGFDPNPEVALQLPATAWKRTDTISGTVAAADWVAICVPERLELLQKVMQRVQAESPEGAVVAVASSVFSIEDVQACALRPATVILADVKTDGGFAFDVSKRSSKDVRSFAETVLSELAAHEVLQDAPEPPYSADAESA